MKTFISDISHQEYPVSERVSGGSLRRSLLEFIQGEHPGFPDTGSLSFTELNLFREKYMTDYLARGVGELSELENTVLNAMKEGTTLTDKLDGDEPPGDTFGQRLADKMASFGGSWSFILSFCAFLFLWVFVNVIWLSNRAFDPFPFILLNLFLSGIASLQAPVIMMSQNRQEEKDRLRAKKDYMINLKAELEIRMLHEKIDHLMMHQQQELLEVQKEQMSMLKSIQERISNRKD